MWGRWEASSAKPFGNTLSRRSLVAVACWIIVASGSRLMSIAVTALGLASAARAFPPARATAQAIAPLSTERVRFLVVSFMVGSFPWFVGGLTDDYSSKANIFLQSFFMLM